MTSTRYILQTTAGLYIAERVTQETNLVYYKKGGNMAFTQREWKNRKSEYPNRRLLTKEDGSTELVTVSREEGAISDEGDAFSAENMNDLEQRITDGFGNLTTYPSNIAVQVHFSTQEAYQEGYYKIKFANINKWMLSCMVMLYQDYKASVILVSGYVYPLNSVCTWYRPNAELVAASESIDTMLVKFGYDTDNLPWFAVPAGNYTGLTICNINNGYFQMPDWSKMITIEYVQTLSGTIKAEITASAPVKSATIRNVEKVSSLPSNAASNPNTLYVIPG